MNYKIFDIKKKFTAQSTNEDKDHDTGESCGSNISEDEDQNDKWTIYEQLVDTSVTIGKFD